MRKRHQSKFYLVLESRMSQLCSSRFTRSLDIALNKDKENNLLNEIIINGSLTEKQDYEEYDIKHIGKYVLNWFYSKSYTNENKLKEIKNAIETVQSIKLTDNGDSAISSLLNKIGINNINKIKALTNGFNKVLDIISDIDKKYKKLNVSSPNNKANSDKSNEDDTKNISDLKLSVDGSSGFRLDGDDIAAIERRRSINKILINKKSLFIFCVCMYKYMGTSYANGGPGGWDEEFIKNNNDENKASSETKHIKIVKLFNVLKIYEYFIDNEKNESNEIYEKNKNENLIPIRNLNENISNEVIEIFKNDLSKLEISETDFCKELPYSIIARRIISKAEISKDFETIFKKYKSEINGNTKKSKIDEKIEMADTIGDLTKDAFLFILKKYESATEISDSSKLDFITEIFSEQLNENENKTIDGIHKNDNTVNVAFNSGDSTKQIDKLSIEYFNIKTETNNDENTIDEQNAKYYLREFNDLIENLNSEKCRIDSLLAYIDMWRSGNYEINEKYFVDKFKNNYLNIKNNLNKKFKKISEKNFALTECYNGAEKFKRKKCKPFSIKFDDELIKMFKILRKDSAYKSCFKNKNLSDNTDDLKEIGLN